jgi:hypothetical protein
MKFLKKLVIASLIAIALIEARHQMATAQPHPQRQVAVTRPLPPREARPLARIRRKIVLRAQRLVAPLTARAVKGERPRWR